jgi:hypothetical protein
MADEQKPKGEKKVKKPKAEAEVVAAAVEAAPPPPPKPHTISTKTPKLAKKNNPHLPRKLKKAQKKAAAAQARLTSTPVQL